MKTWNLLKEWDEKFPWYISQKKTNNNKNMKEKKK
jgi:hypothetical protein